MGKYYTTRIPSESLEEYDFDVIDPKLMLL